MSWKWLEDSPDKKVAQFMTDQRDIKGKLTLCRMEKKKLQGLMNTYAFMLPDVCIKDTWMVHISYQRGGTKNTLKKHARKVVQFPRDIFADFIEKNSPKAFVWATNSAATQTHKKRFEKYLSELKEQKGYITAVSRSSVAKDRVFIAYKQ